MGKFLEQRFGSWLNHPTHQISFHTISALDTLKYIGSEVVDGSEK